MHMESFQGYFVRSYIREAHIYLHSDKHALIPRPCLLREIAENENIAFRACTNNRFYINHTIRAWMNHIDMRQISLIVFDYVAYYAPGFLTYLDSFI